MGNKTLIWYGASFGLQFIISIIITVFTPQLFSSEETVQMFYDLNIATFGGLIFGLGVPQAMLKFRYLKDVKEKSLTDVFLLVLIAAVISATLTSLIIGNLNLLLLSLIIPFTFAQYHVRGNEKFIELSLLFFLRFLVVVIGGYLLFYFSIEESFSWYIVLSISFGVGLFFLPFPSTLKPDKKLFIRLLKYSVPLQAYSFLLTGVFLGAQVVLKNFGSNYDFESYVLLWRVVVIVQGVSAVIFFIFPQYYFKNIQKTPKKVLRIRMSLILSIAIICLIVYSSTELIEMIFDRSFSSFLLGLLLIAEFLRLSSSLINLNLSDQLKSDVLFYAFLFCCIILTIYLGVILSIQSSITILNMVYGMVICFAAYFFISLALNLKYKIAC